MPLNPESKFVVTVTEGEITNQRPDGKIERITLAELGKVFVLTNDTGPWGADVWWIFETVSSGHRVSFPQGATGEQAVVNRLLELPGFDYGQMIKAMSSTSNASFKCWEATTS